ncbi:Hypothetical predicted protein [Mytilus galloprovincialis]|uniref:PiggyBac transposable element-derived protein domain-containing protein n=1 Tax=Mytilus galloprovincialis TaxID=29158 RepID=A0A8B6HN90_MYTGA|nr:Hypothetical predicted protein [Mytilus galloprovincialis]
MADSSDSEQFSDGESDGDFEVISGSSESEDEMNDVPMNANPWFRVRPPEIDYLHDQRFVENSGPQNVPAADAKPIDYFLLFLTLDFLRHIVRETNRYAQDFITSQQRIRRFSRLHSWFKVGAVTLDEMKGFISVILNMGLIHNTTIPNRNDDNYSPTSKFQCFVDLFNRQSKQHYIPKQNLSIDESLIASKGRSSIIQYIPSKAAKFGVKLWVLAEAVSGYICQISVYKGKQYDPTPQGMLQGAYVVNKLLDAAGLFNKAYHLFTDSFFSSINLAKELLAKGTLFTGTLRANRQMPNTIKNPVLQEKESIYIRQGRILLCAYKERNGRKPVRIISSFSKAAQENDKPAMICSYNKFMGGVDLADMMTESYNDGRKTLKVWKKVVFNLMHRMVTNAYIIYKENTSDNPKLSRLSFTQRLIEDLAKDHMVLRNENQDDNRQNKNKHGIRKLPGHREKDCDVCSDRNGYGGRRRSRTVCRVCGKGVHRDCKDNHLCVES